MKTHVDYNYSSQALDIPIVKVVEAHLSLVKCCGKNCEYTPSAVRSGWEECVEQSFVEMAELGEVGLAFVFAACFSLL